MVIVIGKDWNIKININFFVKKRIKQKILKLVMVRIEL